jgi:hypothetical protein
MKYKINDKVYVIKLNVFKTIIDCEKIEGFELYYMSDLTAYPCKDIVSLSECENTFLKIDLDVLDLMVDENGNPLTIN